VFLKNTWTDFSSAVHKDPAICEKVAREKLADERLGHHIRPLQGFGLRRTEQINKQIDGARHIKQRHGYRSCRQCFITIKEHFSLVRPYSGPSNSVSSSEGKHRSSAPWYCTRGSRLCRHLAHEAVPSRPPRCVPVDGSVRRFPRKHPQLTSVVLTDFHAGYGSDLVNPRQKHWGSGIGYRLGGELMKGIPGTAFPGNVPTAK